MPAIILVVEEVLFRSGAIISFLKAGVDDHGVKLTVKDLLKGLYDKSCQQKQWGLVRHTAGIINMRLFD